MALTKATSYKVGKAMTDIAHLRHQINGKVAFQQHSDNKPNKCQDGERAATDKTLHQD